MKFQWSIVAGVVAATTMSVSADVLVDDFSAGSVSITAKGDYVRASYFDSGILGEERELVLRDAWNGFFGDAYAEIDSAAGTFSVFGDGAAVCDARLLYGNAIGTDGANGRDPVFPDSSLRGPELNIPVNPDTEFMVDIGQMSTSFTFGWVPSPSANVIVRVYLQGIPWTYESSVYFEESGEAKLALKDMLDPWGTPITAVLDDGAELDGVALANYSCTTGGLADATVFNSFSLSGGEVDADGDGVLDDVDVCPATELGRTTDEQGCSGLQMVENQCPATSVYNNHGKYVSCVVAASKAAFNLGLISADEQQAMVTDAAQSNIGKKGKG